MGRLAIGSELAPVCVVLVSLISSCDAKETATAAPAAKPPGASCRVASECQQGHACADRVCVRAPRLEDESCGMHASCAPGLVCHPSVITQRKTYEDPGYAPSDTYGDRCLSPEGVAAEAVAAERALLEKSGLSAEEVAEKTAMVEAVDAPAGPGLPVRVVRVESLVQSERGTVFAACRASERLLSGSCGRVQGDNVVRKYIDDAEVGITGHSRSDTVGARWTCVGLRGDTVFATALCQALPDAPR